MKLKAPNAPLSQYPPQVIDAIRIYSLTGNLALASRETGVAYHNLYRIVNRDSIKQDLGQIKNVLRRNLAHKFALAAELSTDRAIDCLINGEEQVDRETGERYRKQMSGRDAAYITSVMAQQFRHETASLEESEFSAKLASLADQLITVASGVAARAGRGAAPEGGESRGEGANLNVEKVVAAPSSHSNGFSSLSAFIS